MTEQHANRLKELREAKGIERYDICVHLRDCGVPTSDDTVRRLEDNRGGPIPSKYLAALVELFGCTVEHLMGWNRKSSETKVAA